MIKFKVSAPDRINLFGENFTCADHNGVMASIDRRTTVKFNEFDRKMSVIKLNFPAIHMNREVLARQFQEFYRSCTFDDTLSEQILEFLSSVNFWRNDHEKILGRIFFYLLAYVTYKEEIDIEDVTPIQVFLEMDLWYNNYFSNFSSIVVCFTTCILHWYNLRRNAHHELNDIDRAKISMYSKSCDKIFTYCKFKSEVTVSTYGSMLRYHCIDSSQDDVLDNMPTMKILIINLTIELFDIGEGRKAKANLINCDPHIVNSILDSIRVLSDTAFSVLKKINDMNKKAATYSQDVSAQEKKLFPLIRVQQELNKIFIKFNEEMNDVCRIAQKNGLAGKCVDFDYPGQAYVWCPSDSEDYYLNMMLIRNDFVRHFPSDIFPADNIYSINLNCDGVKIE